jgi:hypothetical protein
VSLIVFVVPIAELIGANKLARGALLKDLDEQVPVSQHAQHIQWTLDIADLLSFGNPLEQRHGC